MVAAANATLEDLGLPELAPDVILGFVGHGARRLVAAALAAAAADENEGLVEQALALFLARYADHLLDRTVAYPGIPRVIERLAASGVRLSVATNKPERLSLAILRGLGLADRFFAVLGGDSLPTRKPDPAGVELLVRRACVALEETLLVGDSPVDVATARAAGVAVCAVTWGLVDRETLLGAGPDFVAERADDLLRFAP